MARPPAGTARSETMKPSRTAFRSGSIIDRLVEARTLNYDVKTIFRRVSRHCGWRRRRSIHRVSFLADEQTQHRAFVTEVDHAISAAIVSPATLTNFPKVRGASNAARRFSASIRQRSIDEWSRLRLGSQSRTAARASGGASGLSKEIRVISFPTGIVGPALAGLLAEHGAEVITIEAGGRRAARSAESFQIAADLEGNRERKRIAIDMKNPDGVALVKKLIAKSDVVVENFSARVMGSWGLDYPRLKEISPHIIHGELSGFRPDRAAARLCQLWADSHVLLRHGLFLARSGNRTARSRLSDGVSRLHRALIRRAGDTCRAALSRSARAEGNISIFPKPKLRRSMIGPAYLEYLVHGREPAAPGKF